MTSSLASFAANGFAVVSVNKPSEIGFVRDAFPDLNCAPAPADAGIFADRYGPNVGSCAGVLPGSAWSAIANADLFMLRSEIGAVLDANPGTFFVARRLDIDRIGGDIIGVYRRGIDAVFFRGDRFGEVVHDEGLMQFQLGAPFWDIIIPVAASFHGGVAFIDPPFVLHALHTANWTHTDYTELQRKAVLAVIRHAERYATKDGAAAFLRVLRRHVGRRPNLNDRSTIARIKLLLDLWLVALEAANSYAVPVQIDGMLSAEAVEMILQGLPETPLPEAGTRPTRSPIRRARRFVRSWLRQRREDRILRHIFDALGVRIHIAGQLHAPVATHGRAA